MWNNRNHIAIGHQFRPDIRITPETFMDTFTFVRKRLEKQDTRFREAFPIEKSVAIVLRSSHHRCSMKKGVLRNFTKFTRKHLYQSLFFNKVAGLTLATLSKKETLAKVFSCGFCKICKNRFFYRTPLDACFCVLWRLATGISQRFKSVCCWKIDCSKHYRLSKYFINFRPEVFLGKGVLKICKATLLKSHFGMGVLL